MLNLIKLENKFELLQLGSRNT